MAGDEPQPYEKKNHQNGWRRAPALRKDKPPKRLGTSPRPKKRQPREASLDCHCEPPIRGRGSLPFKVLQSNAAAGDKPQPYEKTNHQNGW